MSVIRHAPSVCRSLDFCHCPSPIAIETLKHARRCPGTDPMTAPPAALTARVRIVRWGGEMQLVATDDAVQGALLAAEYPIAFVEIEAEDDDAGPMLLLESILATDETYARVSAEDLKLTTWQLGVGDLATLDALARKYRRNPKKLAQLYHRVAANNIRYAQGGVIGYGIWPIVSRSNHSCDPNARLGATPKQPLAELLLASRPIRAGEAICWNYLGDESFLALDWYARNLQLLKDFRFLCRCPRCEAERPASIAALPKEQIAAYFKLPQP